MGNTLLNVQGVVDYSDLQLNGGVLNINLQEEEIADLASLTLQKEVV